MGYIIMQEMILLKLYINFIYFRDFLYILTILILQQFLIIKAKFDKRSEG